MITWEATVHQRWVAVLEDPIANTGLPSRCSSSRLRLPTNAQPYGVNLRSQPHDYRYNERFGDCGAYPLR